MANSTTRISELPENITTQIQQPSFNMPYQGQGIGQGMGQGQGIGQGPSQPFQNTQVDSMGQNTYVPINIHPNPYGVPPQPPNGLPPPQGSPPRGQGPGPSPGPNYQDPQYQGQSNQMDQYTDPTGGHGQQRLPSRDIPMNQLEYQQDEAIQANYVPKAKLTSDYIKEYELASENAMRQHEQNKYRERVAGDLFSQLQVPILIAIMYFIFQMPIVNTIFRKYLSFLSIYHEDGNFNFMGLLLKSMMFGSVFFSIQTAAYKLSNL